MDTAIREGRTVVCNVSRTIVADLRARYRHVTVILVTAPKSVRLARLAARARASDGDLALRQRREQELQGGMEPDAVIENVGDPAEGASALLGIIRAVRDGKSGANLPARSEICAPGESG